MTRASQGSAPVFRAMHSKRSGTGGNYPQWMRTLEEKYQKLHRKITENTGMMGNPRFSHGLGKSVYDARLSHVLLKYRDIGSAKVNNKPNTTTKKGGSSPNECDPNIENRTEQTTTCKSNTPDVLNSETNEIDKQTQQSNNNRQNLDFIENNLVEEECDSDLREFDADLQDLKQIENLIGDKDDSELVDNSKECLESDGGNICDKKRTELIGLDLETNNKALTHETKQKGVKTKVVHIEGSKNHRRHLKTSVSRTSKLTSRSCPAKIQSKSAANLKTTETPLLSRNISAQKNSKMFTPMSEEAKHAITETIEEMNISLVGRREGVKGEVHFIPSRTRKCVKNWNTPKQVKPKVLYNAKPVINGVSRALEELNDDGVKSGVSETGNEFSLQSSAGSSFKERLPDIQTDGNIDRNQTRNQSYRLPGIGKYDISQTDSQFEITPPGFDVRYNEMQPVEERDSETPPPDIRQRAIDKCAEWLNKYSK